MPYPSGNSPSSCSRTWAACTMQMGVVTQPASATGYGYHIREISLLYHIRKYHTYTYTISEKYHFYITSENIILIPYQSNISFTPHQGNIIFMLHQRNILYQVPRPLVTGCTQGATPTGNRRCSQGATPTGNRVRRRPGRLEPYIVHVILTQNRGQNQIH